MAVENWLVSDFTFYGAEKPSKLVPGRAMRGPIWFGCPRCKARNPEPRHGFVEECGACGLCWRALGNGLTIWDEQETQEDIDRRLGWLDDGTKKPADPEGPAGVKQGR